MSVKLWVATLVCLGVLVSGARATFPEKKIIYFGWDMPSDTQRILEGIDEWQDLPFDGIAVRIRDYCFSFANRGYDEEAVQKSIEEMKQVKWGRFTDNFMWMIGGDDVDWFDEEAWSDDGFIIRNVRVVARIGKAGGFAGILFDPEMVFWGRKGNGWDYRKMPNKDKYSVHEYRMMARRRGEQYINAIEEFMPNTNFITLFWSIKHTPGIALAKAKSEEERDRIVAEAEEYGLVSDFMIGVLKGADKGTMIYDGMEVSYGSVDTWDFARHNQKFRDTYIGAIPPELRYKFRAQTGVSQPVYLDPIANTIRWAQHSVGTYMTPEERGKVVGHVVYQALTTSDKYHWFYSERGNFLRGKKLVHPETIKGIRHAVEAYQNGRPLGYDVAKYRARAKRQFDQVQYGPLTLSTAKIKRTDTPPRIDGKLDDAAWKNLTALGPFQRYRIAARELQTETVAYVTYDDENIYFGLKSKNPDTSTLHARDISEDDEERQVNGAGDLFHIVLAADARAEKYYSIIITVKNSVWSSLSVTGEYPRNEIQGYGTSWSPRLTHATGVTKTHWMAEMAIPWKEMNRKAPAKGEKIGANIILRAPDMPDGYYDFSSWSQMRWGRFPEGKTLGTFVFE